MLYYQYENENINMAGMAFGNMHAKLIQASPTIAKTNRNVVYNDIKCNAEVDSKLRSQIK